MSYDLEIFSGDPAAPESSFKPLDCRMAWHVLENLLAQEHVERDRDELVWFLPTRTVDILIGEEDETVQSIGISMVWGDRSQVTPPSSTDAPGTTPQERDDLGRVYLALLSLAEKLGASLYDPQAEEFVSRAALVDFVARVDRDPALRQSMDYAGDEAVYPRTTDAEGKLSMQRATSYSPWLVLLVIVGLGIAGINMAREDKLKDVEPMLKGGNALSNYLPASKRNAVPQADVWVDNDYVIHRSAVRNAREPLGMIWEIRADGEVLHRVSADDRKAVQLTEMKPGVVYTAQLKILDGSYDGAGRNVSEMVSFSLR